MYKFIKYLLSVGLLAIMFSVSAYSKTPEVKEGMWSWSMTMEMAGMQMPAMVYDDCVSKKDFIPQQKTPGQKCKMLKNKVSKEGVEWKMECTSEAGKSTSSGKIIYTKITAKGQIDVITQGMTMKSKITGKYTGKCK